MVFVSKCEKTLSCSCLITLIVDNIQHAKCIIFNSTLSQYQHCQL